MRHLKIFSFLMLVIMTEIIPFMASAYNFMVDGLWYRTHSDGTTVEVTSDYAHPSSGYSGLSGNLTIPASVTYNDVTYSVTEIGLGAFEGCNGLTSVSIPNSVIEIDSQAFCYCSGLTSVIIPNSVTTIGSHAFAYCTALTSVNLPNSLKSIHEWAFMGCTGLTSITIPQSVTNIGNNPFAECSNLASIVVEDGNPYYNSRGNCNAIIYYNNPYHVVDNAIVSGCKNTTIPSDVKAIYRGAFYGCTELTSIVIPYSVNMIYEEAFINCHFTSVTIPNTLKDRPWDYYIIPSIESFYSDRWDTLTIVGNGTWNNGLRFYNNVNEQIKTLNIGSHIRMIDISGSSNLFALDVINCYSEIPPNLSEWAPNLFSSSCYDGELHVPAGTAEAYSAADFWKNFKNIIPDLTDNITLNRTSASVSVGSSVSLWANVLPDGGNVVWSTSDASVATVDANGTVTATGDGECDIFATLACNTAVYASCHINVNCNETILSDDGYLIYQIIDPEKHEVALTGYNETVMETGDFWGTQFPPDKPVIIPSTITKNGEEEYTVTEIADNALQGLGGFSNPERYTNFFPSIILPETVRRIGKYALQTNAEAPGTIVTLPHSLESIDDYCFLYGAGDGRFIIYENVNNIGKGVFRGFLGYIIFLNHDFEVNSEMCDINSISHLEFLGEYLSIAANTFTNADIYVLEFGLYPCSIASNAFSGNCNINIVVSHSAVPFDIPDDAFASHIYQNAVLRVPKSSIDSYRNAPGWRNFINIVELTDGDVNVDGTVTASDVTSLFSNLLNNEQEYMMNYDQNNDGQVTASDITKIYEIILK